MRDGKERARIAIAGAAAAGALLSACSLLTSLDGYASHGAPNISDGAPGDGARSDAAPSEEGGADPNRPRAWRQLSVSGPAARHSARMVFDASRGRAVLVDGLASPEYTNDVWEWDGATWRMAALSGTPNEQHAFGLVYHAARKSLILAGGGKSAELIGETWATLSGTVPPFFAYAAAMDYDSDRGLIVGFGGSNGETSSDKLYEWTPASGWQERTLPSRPPRRRAHVLVYDPARKQLVAFGGAATDAFDDTWTFDGVAWTERRPLHKPSARGASCAAWDPRRKKVVLFGGRGNDQTSLKETWEWDGNDWAPGPAGPPARRACAMTYDPLRDTIVLFGGTSARNGKTYVNLDDTWVYE